MTRYFTAEYVWDGGLYIMWLDLGQRSDDVLYDALAQLWSHPDLDGCYLDRQREPEDQPRIPATEFTPDHGPHALGLARLPNGAQVACGAIPSRLDPDRDALEFYLPIGALEGVYPMEDNASGKRPEYGRARLDDWLTDLAR